MKKGIIPSCMALAAIASATGFLWVRGGQAQPPKPVAQAIGGPVAPGTPTPGSSNDAPLPKAPDAVAEAPIAMLVDLNSGRTLYAKEAAKPFLPASVTKTMTAFVAFELMDAGKLAADKPITISDAAWREWHRKGSRMFLEPRTPATVDQLLMGIMNVSANDGAVALAEGVAGSTQAWVAKMNDAAHRLGMNDSHFGTPNGWMDNGNTHVSARDLVKLADAMITRYPQYYKRYVGHPGYTWNNITQPNHLPILDNVRGADGIKTGFTGEAMYTMLGSAERDGRRLVVVLAGVNRPRARATAAKALLEWGYAAWDDQPLVPANTPLGHAKVQGGRAASVPLVAPRALMASLPHGTKAAVTMRITYQGPLMAPIAKGAPVAELEVTVGHGAPSRVPLLAGEAVEKGGTVDRLRAGLLRLVS